MTGPNEIPKTKKWPFLLIPLLLLYLIVALAHATLAPLTIGPDELAHYEYVRFIADQGRLPLNNAERGQASYKSDQPPLYHYLAALPVAFVDPTGPPTLKRVTDHPRRQLIERTRHAWGLYNTEDERWPYRAEVLRWHIGRWVAILFGAATVAVTFFIACEVFGRYLPNARSPVSNARSRLRDNAELLALGTAAVVAFTPRFALTGSMLNYETAMAFFAALFLWVLLRLTDIKFTRPIHSLWYVLLGLFTGLAITAKLSAIILPLEVVIGLWLLKRYHGWSWRRWWQGALIAGVSTIVTVSWWFGFILIQFNTITQEGWWAGTLRPLIAADSSDATTNQLLSFLTNGESGFTAAIDNLDSGPPWEWAAIFFRTFWVVGIERVQPLGWFGLGVALLFCLLATWGLVYVWRNAVQERVKNNVFNQNLSNSPQASPSTHLILSLLLLHLLIPLVLPLIRYAVTFSLADTAQGRHVLFAAAPAFAILLIWGLCSITNYQLPITQLAIPSLLPGLFLLFWSGVQLWTMTWAYHPLLPVQTEPMTNTTIGEPLNLAIDETITLVGFEQRFTADKRLLRLDLMWHATAVSPVDYLTEVSLLDKEGVSQSQWSGYPASGRYPTRAWDVGDYVRDTAWLPLHGLAPGDYQLMLDLTATRLDPPGSSPPPLEAPIMLSTLTLDDAIAVDNTSQIWQSGLPLASTQTFRYRETILVTLGRLEAEQPGEVWLTGPLHTDYQRRFNPQTVVNNTALFIVGPDWSTGEYVLQTSTDDALPNDAEGQVKIIDRWERQFDEPEMSTRIEANFADQVKLLGYDLEANRAQPGGGIPLTLYWQGLDWMGTDYTIFTKLIAADQTVHGGRDRLPREGYRTLYWAPGEIVADSFGVPVESDAPEGIYYLNIGLYEQVGEQAISLPLVQDGKLLETTSVTLGPIKIGQALPGLTLESASPQVLLNQPFGNAPHLTLLGYDLNQLPITNYQVPFTLYWRSESPLPIDYTTFVHVRDADGQVVAQKDQPPLHGAYPTSLWDTAEIIADEILVSLPAELPQGRYDVIIGLYDLQTGQRLAVPDIPAHEVHLTSIEVP